MIDVLSDEVVSLAEAAKLFPRVRGSKKPHLSTLYRWVTRGIRGVKLETVRVGGTLVTSKEAIQRFVERGSNPESSSTPEKLTKHRQKQIDRAEQELAELGI